MAMTNTERRLSELIEHFGPPSFSQSVRYDKYMEYYWFNHMITFSSSDNTFGELKLIKTNWFSKQELLFMSTGGKLIRCNPTVQAAWRMEKIDSILLGDNNDN